jgi:hypothetical protein
LFKASKNAAEVAKAAELRMKSRVAQSSGVSRAARSILGVGILSWFKIDSDEGGEVKSPFTVEVLLVTEALGADVWPTEMLQSLTVFFYRQLPGGEFPVHSQKVDKDEEEPRLTAGCDRR